MTEEWILRLGSIALAITAIISFLMFVYKKLVTEPWARETSVIRDEQDAQLKEIRKEQTDQLKAALEPLVSAIERLNELITKTEENQEILRETNREQNENILDNYWKIKNLENFKTEHLKYHEKHNL